MYSFCDIETQIRNMLLSRRCPTTRGYTYLKQCIAIAVFDPESIHSINKTIYKQVATENGTTIDSVERCIRTLVTKWWENGLAKSDLFAKSPTNKECIVRFVEMIEKRKKPQTMDEWVKMWEGTSVIDSLLEIS